MSEVALTLESTVDSVIDRCFRTLDTLPGLAEDRGRLKLWRGHFGDSACKIGRPELQLISILLSQIVTALESLVADADEVTEDVADDDAYSDSDEDSLWGSPESNDSIVAQKNLIQQNVSQLLRLCPLHMDFSSSAESRHELMMLADSSPFNVSNSLIDALQAQHLGQQVEHLEPAHDTRNFKKHPTKTFESFAEPSLGALIADRDDAGDVSAGMSVLAQFSEPSSEKNLLLASMCDAGSKDWLKVVRDPLRNGLGSGNGSRDVIWSVEKPFALVAAIPAEMATFDVAAALSAALNMARQAILADSPNGSQNALDCYVDTCRLLQFVKDRNSEDEIKHTTGAMKSIYSNRIAELLILGYGHAAVIGIAPGSEDGQKTGNEPMDNKSRGTATVTFANDLGREDDTSKLAPSRQK